MSSELRLPPFKDSERQSGYVEHLYLMYNKQYRELGYMYCDYHKDILKSGNAGCCIKCNPKYFTCGCGSVIRKSDLSQHRKTKKHLNYLKILDSESESDTESMKEWKEAENMQGYDDIN